MPIAFIIGCVIFLKFRNFIFYTLDFFSNKIILLLKSLRTTALKVISDQLIKFYFLIENVYIKAITLHNSVVEDPVMFQQQIKIRP